MPRSRILWAVGGLLSLSIAPALLLAQEEGVKNLFGGTPEFKRGDRRNLTAARDMLWSGYLDQGIDYLGMAHYAEAESQFGSAVALAEKFESNDPRLPESLTWLAQALTHEGKYVEAEKLYRRALTIYERVLGPCHETIANVLGALGSNQYRKGEYVEAERLYTQSLGMFEKTQGEKSPRVAQVLGHLATLNSTQGRFTQAEPLRKRSLAIYEAILSRDNPFLYGNFLEMALIYRKRGKGAEAEAQYKKALALLEKIKGPNDPKVAELLLTYASLLKTMDRAAEAEGLQARVQAIQENQPRPITVPSQRQSSR